jgi:hypothetical protein
LNGRGSALPFFISHLEIGIWRLAIRSQQDPARRKVMSMAEAGCGVAEC